MYFGHTNIYLLTKVWQTKWCHDYVEPSKLSFMTQANILPCTTSFDFFLVFWQFGGKSRALTLPIHFLGKDKKGTPCITNKLYFCLLPCYTFKINMNWETLASNIPRDSCSLKEAIHTCNMFQESIRYFEGTLVNHTVRNELLYSYFNAQ